MKRLLLCIVSVLVLSSAIGCIPKRDVKIKTAADCENDPNPTTRAKCLVDLGIYKYNAGAELLAIDLLSRASSACDEISDPEEKSAQLLALSDGYSKIKDKVGAQNSLKKARMALEAVKDAGTKIESLIKLAKIQENSEDIMGAATTADAAVGQIEEGFLPDTKAQILITAAEIYAGAGNAERRDELYAQLAGIADQLTEDLQKSAELYGLISVSQTKLTLADAAKASYEKAVAIADGAEDLEMKGFAYFKLAEMQWSLKNKETTEALIKKAESVVPSLSKKKADRGAELDNSVTSLKKELE